MEKFDIIKEILGVYAKNPLARSFSDGTCRYYDEVTENMCAVGQAMMPEDAKHIAACGNNTSILWYVADTYGDGNLDNLLQEKYRGHDSSFWYRLQTIHDDGQRKIWDSMGMTEYGRGLTLKTFSNCLTEEQKTELSDFFLAHRAVA